MSCGDSDPPISAGDSFAGTNVGTIREYDTAVLERDIPEHGLVKGDVGAVVHVYDGGRSYEVEFTSGAGDTIAVLTLESGEVRVIDREDILHARRRGGER